MLSIFWISVLCAYFCFSVQMYLGKACSSVFVLAAICKCLAYDIEGVLLDTEVGRCVDLLPVILKSTVVIVPFVCTLTHHLTVNG